MSEYIPVDFSKIVSVDLIDKSDDDYIEWKKKIYGKKKKTDAQLRREQEYKNHPVFFEKIKEIWSSGNFETTPQPQYQIKKERFVLRELKKWGKQNPHLVPKLFFEYCCAVVGFNYYLYDLGIKERPKRNNWRKGKEKEDIFRGKVRNISKINIIDKFFKIHLKDNTTFKFPDIIFKTQAYNKHSIIEYKAVTYYGELIQLVDYEKLFYMATGERPNLYWIVQSGWEYDMQKLREKAYKKYKDKIKVLDEEGFLLSYTGLDAWM